MNNDLVYFISSVLKPTIDDVIRTMSSISYTLAGILITGEWLKFLDSHASAMGVIIGFLTFITNLIFQIIRHKSMKEGS